MITAKGLQQLGFTKSDFVLQDDGDGAYIAEWKSDQAQPSVDDIEAAHTEWVTAMDAEAAQKAADKASGNAKLKALGLTDAEIEAIT
tara:strand:- start:29179 stop:29439 length:261 start_codon:yes stop_codon:yes gene_type:complete